MYASPDRHGHRRPGRIGLDMRRLLFEPLVEDLQIKSFLLMGPTSCSLKFADSCLVG